MIGKYRYMFGSVIFFPQVSVSVRFGISPIRLFTIFCTLIVNPIYCTNLVLFKKDMSEDMHEREFSWPIFVMEGL